MVIRITKLSNLDKTEIEIIKTWHGNRKKTILLALPSAISRRYDLDKPTYVVLEPKQDGILLKKLEVAEKAV